MNNRSEFICGVVKALSTENLLFPQIHPTPCTRHDVPSKQEDINLNTDEALNCRINIIKIQERIYIVWINFLGSGIWNWSAQGSAAAWKYANKNLIWNVILEIVCYCFALNENRCTVRGKGIYWSWKIRSHAFCFPTSLSSGQDFHVRLPTLCRKQRLIKAPIQLNFNNRTEATKINFSSSTINGSLTACKFLSPTREIRKSRVSRRLNLMFNEPILLHIRGSGHRDDIHPAREWERQR